MHFTRTAMLPVSSLAIALALAAPKSAAADPGGASVVGGHRVPPGHWPDAVAVLGPGGRCTGTLIAPDVVLTAGHCVAIEPRWIVADAIELGAEAGEWIEVDRAVAYPDWERTYDVGVLVLAHAARTPPRAVARGCTADAAFADGRDVEVVGFGRTTAEDSPTRTVAKHEATIPVVDPTCTTDASCQAAIAPDGEMIAGGDGHDACFGDSGGPAYVVTGDRAAVLGVVSRGLAGDWACGRGGVYVRADRVATWIEETTGRELSRPACEDAGTGDAPDGRDDGGCRVAPASTAVVPLTAAALAVGCARRRRRRRAATAA